MKLGLGGRRLRDPWFWFSLLCAALAVLLIVLPLVRVAAESMASGTGLAALVANYITFFSKSRYLLALRNSMTVVLISTALAALLAVPLSYLLARYDLRARRS